MSRNMRLMKVMTLKNKKIINLDKNGNVIKDLSKVDIPYDLRVSIFEIMNPNMTAAEEKVATK